MCTVIKIYDLPWPRKVIKLSTNYLKSKMTEEVAVRTEGHQWENKVWEMSEREQEVSGNASVHCFLLWDGGSVRGYSWSFSTLTKRAGQQAAAATTVWGGQQRKFHHSTIYAHKCVLFDKSSMQCKVKVTEFRVWWRRALSVRAVARLLVSFFLTVWWVHIFNILAVTDLMMHALTTMHRMLFLDQDRWTAGESIAKHPLIKNCVLEL